MGGRGYCGRMNGRCDVVVIGGTIAGLTSAIELRRQGMRVVVLDPNDQFQSVVTGPGVVSPAGALTGVAEERPPHDLGGYVAAQGFVEQVAEAAKIPRLRTSLSRRTVNKDSEPVSARLKVSGIRLAQATDQPIAHLQLRPGWSAKDALLVDPSGYGTALVELALNLGVEFVHNATITRFRHAYSLHTVHYRSQIAWQPTMYSLTSPRQIDTIGVSPWGRQVTAGSAAFAPIIRATGMDLSQVVVTPDSPAHVLRPDGDDVLVSGHAVSPPALETVTVGLSRWLEEHLHLSILEVGGFGVQPTPAQDPRVGASPVPGAFWAGGHGMWELTRGTASGLWLADRLMNEGTPDRLPLANRLRARVRRTG